MKNGLICILFCLLGFTVMGQEVTFTASVNKTTIPLNSRFQLELTLTNARGDIQLAELKNFKRVQGPSVSTKTTIINGRASRTFAHTYILQPVRTGVFEIPPARARVNGKILQSNPVKITVTEASETPQPDNNSDFFIVAQPNKRSAFLGEPIQVSVKVYSRYNHFRARQLDYPSLGGFWTEEITNENWEWEPGVEVVNGRQFRVLILKNYVLFPQESGKLTFGSVEMEAAVSTSFFSRDKVISARSKPITFNIKPRPEGKPDGFLGTYQRLDISSEISRTTVNANESFELSVTFNGVGNLNLLDEPNLDFPESFEVFDPQTADNISVTASGVSGRRTFTYVLVPRKKGNYSIPKKQLSYFNSLTGKYQSYEIGPFEIEVLPSQSGNGGGYTYNSQTDVNILSQDIRFIKTDTRLKPRSNWFFGSITYFGLMSLPLILLLALIAWKRKLVREERDTVGTKMRRAGKVARKQLSKAKSLAGAGNEKEFYAELSRAIYAYFSNKFNLSRTELNKNNIRNSVQNILTKEEISQLMNIMQACEMAQYAPTGGGNQEDLIRETEKLIKKVEESKR